MLLYKKSQRIGKDMASTETVFLWFSNAQRFYLPQFVPIKCVICYK